jgi:hypothetical protein
MRKTIEIIQIPYPAGLAPTWIVTCLDWRSGTLLGGLTLAAADDGSPPRLTLGHLAEMIGGRRPQRVLLELQPIAKIRNICGTGHSPRRAVGRAGAQRPVRASLAGSLVHDDARPFRYKRAV